jgi:DDE superfamily endonuclease
VQKFHRREYQRCVADVFKVVGHEFARRINVMPGVAGRVRDFPDLAVAVVGPCFTRDHCRPETVENVGMKTDPLARSKAEMPNPHAFSLRHESSSNVPIAGLRDEILTERRCAQLSGGSGQVHVGVSVIVRSFLALQLRFLRVLNPWATTMIRISWTRVASIEETLALWAASLREIKKRMRPLFKQDRVVANAGLFLDGLLGDEQRKTGWMRAEAAGDPGPWRQQAILGRSDWDADALRDIVRDYVVEHLADDDAVLVIDETGFLKQGKASCGVGGNTRAPRASDLICNPGLREAERGFAERIATHARLVDVENL